MRPPPGPVTLAASILAALPMACGGGADTGAGAWELCLPGSVCPIVGTGELGFNGDGLPARETRLASPTSVLLAPDGAVVVVDYSNMRLRTVRDDGTVATVAGNGVHAYAELGVPAPQSPLENPIHAAWGPDGLLYVLPQHEGRVLRVEPSGAFSCVAGTGALGDALSGTDAHRAEMGYLDGLAVADDGTLYVSDSSFGRVRRISPDGVLDNVLGGDDPDGPTQGHGPDVVLDGPAGLLLDGDTLYVADTGADRVLALSTDTLDTRIVADGADLDGPVGLALAPGGGLLVSELGGDRIRLVAADGGVQTVVGTSGPCTSPGQAGEPPASACLADPAGMAWTDDGDLLVAERGGHRVLRWLGADRAL